MKNNQEEVWREEFECTYKTKDNEIGWVYYLQARKKSQEEIDSLRVQLLAQCKISKELLTEKEQIEQELQKTRDEIEFWKNGYVSHFEAMCKCQQELKKAREQLNTCEKLLMRFVPDEKIIQWEQRELDAKQYFKDKQSEG